MLKLTVLKKIKLSYRLKRISEHMLFEKIFGRNREDREIYVMRSFTICTLQLIISECSNQRG